MKKIFLFGICLALCTGIAGATASEKEDDSLKKIKIEEPLKYSLYPFKSTKEECDKFEDMRFLDGWCFNKNNTEIPENCSGIQSLSFGKLSCCDDKNPIMLRYEESTCPNRIVLNQDSPDSDVIFGVKYSVLPCPKDKPLLDLWARCHSCDEKEEISIAYNYGAEGKAKEACPNRVVDRWFDHSHLLCPADKPFQAYGGECFSCDSDRIDGKMPLTFEDCEKCPGYRMFKGHCVLATCPEDKPFRDTTEHFCYGCEQDSFTPEKPEDCAKCPDHAMVNGRCIRKNCPKDKPFRGKYGYCYSCDFDSIEPYTPEECAKCPNRSMFGKNCALTSCPADEPFKGSEGDCYSCDFGSKEPNTPEECAKCPGYSMFGKYCALTTCPADKPFRSENGYCGSCDFKSEKPYSPEECAKCPGHSMFGEYCALPCPKDKPFRGNYGYCYSCDFDSKEPYTPEECAKCPGHSMFGKYCALPCTKDKPFRADGGECYSCDYDGGIRPYTPEECAKCSNRSMFKTEYSSVCALTTCPADEPIRAEDGRCVSCDVRAWIEPYSPEECAKCPNRSMVKTYRGEMCVLPCPADKPIRNSDGYCESCNFGGWREPYSPEECAKCPGVKLKDGYCVKS